MNTSILNPPPGKPESSTSYTDISSPTPPRRLLPCSIPSVLWVQNLTLNLANVIDRSQARKADWRFHLHRAFSQSRWHHSQRVTWLNIRSSDYLLTPKKNAKRSRGVPPRGSLRGMCARLLFAADAKFPAAGTMPCVQQRGGKMTACRNMYILYYIFQSGES